jgi:hypothetical protein
MSYSMKFVRLQNILLSEELKARFKKVGKQETDNPVIVAKFFNPCGAGTWYLSEYSEMSNLGYGYVTGFDTNEWGYVSIAELEGILCPPLGLPIERDRYFNESRFSELKL